MKPSKLPTSSFVCVDCTAGALLRVASGRSVVAVGFVGFLNTESGCRLVGFDATGLPGIVRVCVGGLSPLEAPTARDEVAVDFGRGNLEAGRGIPDGRGNLLVD
jgi:hypothetical protein